MKRSLLLLCLALPLWGQLDRDFLTPDEVDQIREVQEPNERLQLYVQFARQRIDRIQQSITQGKPGRSVLIHSLLEDYTKIIEAIDTVADDAIKRKVAIDVGIKAVADAEKEMAAALKKIQESNPKDLSRYEFALKNAIDTTDDSADLSSEDLKTRTQQVDATVKKEKKEREAMMGTEEVEKKKSEEQKEADSNAKNPKRKPPTLRRPGETLPSDTK